MRAKKVDVNQKAIVTALRKLGYSVAVTSSLGEGFPDLVVAKNGKTILVELKDGSKPPSQRRLTEHEKKFHENWKGKIIVAESVKNILCEV